MENLAYVDILTGGNHGSRLEISGRVNNKANQISTLKLTFTLLDKYVILFFAAFLVLCLLRKLSMVFETSFSIDVNHDELLLSGGISVSYT